MLASPDKKDSRVVKTLEELVGTYDPKTEVVIVFWPANEELVYWYVSSHQPPPPEAVNHGALKLPDLPN